MTETEEARKRVLKLITEKRDEISRFLSEYVRHKSVNPLWESGAEEKTCQDWLRDQLTSWGSFDKVDHWEVEKDRPNVVASLRGEETDREALMLDGHSDVVPVSKESLDRWVVDPWGGELRDGRVYGRGACDMKGGNTAFIWAARFVSEAGVKLKRSVHAAINIAEESGQHKVGIDAVVDRGYRPAFVVCAEPSDLRICPVGVGVFFFRLRVTGKPIHTSMRYRCIFPQPYGVEIPGVGAIEKMTKFLSGFEDLERQWGLRKRNRFMPPGTSNLIPTIIEGGEYVGGLAGRCEVIYNVWLSPDDTFEETVREIKSFVERIAGNDDWLREHPPLLQAPIEEFPEFMPPINVPVDHPGCVALAEAYRSALGREALWGGFTATSDLSWLKNKGVTGVVLGPGDLSMGAHGDNEYVPVEQVIDCCKVYADMILRWCGVSGLM